MKLVSRSTITALFAVMALGVAPQAYAAGVKYSDGDKYIKIGGRVQVQYHSTNTDGGATSDEVFLRRLRPFIEGSVHKDWKGKIQVDFGKGSGDNEVAVKDAYMQYTALKAAKITFGNKSFPFSREKQTSSKKIQFVERGFVGDHNYGTPDRQLGLFAEGMAADSKVSWGASVASASIDPAADKLDFDSPVNKSADFNEGWIIGGRVDYHPFGYLGFTQGDFVRTEMKATVGVSAFTWNNDGDNNGSANSVESVTGFELSGAFRYMGVSVDAQYNIFNSDTIDSTLTSGIYRNGTTDLKNFSLKVGYMVVPDRLELAVGTESQDADGYTDVWTRTNLGLNYFMKKHDIKAQATYRIGKDVDGTNGNDVDEVFVQAQYVF